MILALEADQQIVLSCAVDDIGADRFSGTAGDVRFSKGTLELDKDGDGTADLALLMPNTDSLKASNLIL